MAVSISRRMTPLEVLAIKSGVKATEEKTQLDREKFSLNKEMLALQVATQAFQLPYGQYQAALPLLGESGLFDEGDMARMRSLTAEQLPGEAEKFGSVLHKVQGPNGEAVLAQISNLGNARIVEGISPPQEEKDPSKLRNTFLGETTDFRDVNSAYGRVLEAAQNPSAAGDVALIFAYMKMLDPGSVVREGEFATAEQAQGVPSQIVNLYNRAISGERLPDTVRMDFLSQARNLYQNASAQHGKTEDEFRRIAQSDGLNPDSVIVNRRTAGDVASPQSRADFDALPSGSIYVSPANGKLYRKP